MLIRHVYYCVFLFKQKTAYEMRISDWSSDVCSSDLRVHARGALHQFCGLRVLHRDVACGTDEVGLEEAQFAQLRGIVLVAEEMKDQLEVVRTLGEIGRASCRERVVQYVESSVVAVSLKEIARINSVIRICRI